MSFITWPCCCCAYRRNCNCLKKNMVSPGEPGRGRPSRPSQKALGLFVGEGNFGVYQSGIGTWSAAVCSLSGQMLGSSGGTVTFWHVAQVLLDSYQQQKIIEYLKASKTSMHLPGPHTSSILERKNAHLSTWYDVELISAAC